MSNFTRGGCRSRYHGFLFQEFRLNILGSSGFIVSAEANLIMRREETAAMRSQANAACASTCCGAPARNTTLHCVVTKERWWLSNGKWESSNGMLRLYSF
jgi:hypothetical protein